MCGSGASRDDVIAYMLAKRAIEVEQRGIKTGIDPESARAFVTAHPEFETANQTLNAARTGKLAYMADAGVISQETLTKLADSGIDYAPLARYIEGKSKAGTLGQSFTVLKKLTGSEEKILDPIAVDIENFHTAVAVADRNRAMHSLVSEIDIDPAAFEGIVAKVKKPLQKIAVTDKELAAHLKAHGIDAEDIGALVAYRARNTPLAENQAIYFRNGKAEVYEFADPNLAALFRTMSPKEAGLVTNIMRGFAAVARDTITRMPLFPLVNTFSDAIASAALTPKGGFPFADFMAGIGHAYKKDALYKEFVRSGGAGASLVAMERNYIRRDIDKLFAETGTSGAVWNALKYPYDKLGDWQEFLDTANRLGRYKRLQAAGDDRVAAAIGARRAYLDFRQSGASDAVNWFASVTPFFRPAMLGMQQIGKGFKERPVTTTAKLGAFVVAPSIVSYAINMYALGKEHRDWYQSLPKWTRDLYWILPLPTPDGWSHIKLKKPPGIGLAGTYAERFFDWAYEHSPTAWQDIMASTVDAFLPNYLPSAYKPIHETLVTGNSTFTGHPLVPRSLDGATGHMQYKEYTSGLARELSRFLGAPGLGIAEVSPIYIDTYVRDWLNQPGMMVLHMLDVPLGKTTVPKDLSENPFVASLLVREPRLNAAQITEFWNRREDYSKALRDYQLAEKRAMQSGDATELREALTNPKYHTAKAVEQYAEVLKRHQAAVTAIHSNPKLTVDEKRQFTEPLYRSSLKVAETGLQMMDAIEK